MNKNQLKYSRADEVIKSLDDEQIRGLSMFVQRIRRSHAKIIGMADASELQQACAECKGGCCIVTIEDEIDEVDYSVMIIGAASEQKEKIEAHLERDNHPYCCFKDKEGCVIPQDIRPAVCRTFYCEERMPELKRIMDVRRISVYEECLLLHKAFKEMGFDIGCGHIRRYNGCV